MGLFSSDKPHVTNKEFHKNVRSELYGHGFKHKELTQLEGFVNGDMRESNRHEKGIDAQEIDELSSWLRQNPKAHTFNEKQIGQIEETLKKHL